LFALYTRADPIVELVGKERVKASLSLIPEDLILEILPKLPCEISIAVQMCV